MTIVPPPARPASRLAPIFVDQTHCIEARAITGLERVALEQFGAAGLAPLPVTPIGARTRMGMMARQTFLLPKLLAANPRAILLCPGFPPSVPATMFGARVVPYVHDLFLLTRPTDLNFKARAYMVPSFRFAVKRARRFFVNSEKTRAELRALCRPDATIELFRPPASNPFALTADARADREERPKTLKLVALGTVEPRKNLRAAAGILQALRAGPFPQATLDVMGRIGWGGDAQFLASVEGVTLHGFQSADQVRERVDAADLFITTSHDEGLGSPPLEAQWSGLPVLAPNLPVFREALQESAAFIDSSDPAGAAARIAALVHEPGWRARYARQGVANVTRWNEACARDRDAAIALIERLASGDLAC